MKFQARNGSSKNCTHREITFSFLLNQSKTDCVYHLPIDIVSKEIPFGFKSIGKSLIHSIWVDLTRMKRWFLWVQRDRNGSYFHTELNNNSMFGGGMSCSVCVWGLHRVFICMTNVCVHILHVYISSMLLRDFFKF